GGVDPCSMAKMMSVEDMDKRIADLRAVENWLRMNLSMLSSTIQGLEVQRSTVATLKTFMDTGMATMAQPTAGAQPRPDAGANRRGAAEQVNKDDTRRQDEAGRRDENKCQDEQSLQQTNPQTDEQ